MTIWTFLPIVILFVLFFMKIPVSFSLLISAAAYFLFSPNSMDITMLVQKMVAANSSFTYLAIPFFTCLGVVLEYSGISQRLVGLCEALVGHIAGGLAHVNILLSAMMGGLSGSANADAAFDTKVLVPQMERYGLSKPYACAVTAASSCITPIIPPGIILILYASASDVSIAKIFTAGYVPGILMTVFMMILTYFIAKKRGYEKSREKMAPPREIFRLTLDALWALFIPLGLIMALRFGWFTPTEAGAVSVFYGLFVGFFVYKELKIKDIIPIIKESVQGTAGIMFILAGAQAFSAYLTWERLPQIISQFMVDNVHSPILFLLIVNIGLLIVGCFFDGGAAMILMAPLLVPAAEALGINLIQFGIVLSINLTIAGVTPPFGSQMFVTTSIAGVRIEDYARESVPYIGCLLLVLLLTTYIPGISLLIPNLLY